MNHKYCTEIFKDEKLIQNNIFYTLLICYFVLYNVFFESKNDLNGCVHGLRNYQKTQKKSSDNVVSGTGAKSGGIAHIHIFMYTYTHTYSHAHTYTHTSDQRELTISWPALSCSYSSL